MKKLVILSVFMLGIVLNAAAIKVFVAWEESSPDCISYIVIVTEDDGRLIGAASGQIGAGCGQQYVDTDPDSPNDMDFLMGKHPEIQDEIDDAYTDYRNEQ